jgi:hypothetical protein
MYSCQDAIALKTPLEEATVAAASSVQVKQVP